MRELTLNEVEQISGGSTWGENVLKYAGVGGAIGAFTPNPPVGAAVGILAGAIVGTIVTIAE